MIDPFRPGLRYHALTDRKFDLLDAQHLRAVRRVFEEAQVFIFTLGLTEALVSQLDGAVFPACPGTIAGTFEEPLDAFVNFSVDEVTSDLDAFVTDPCALNRGFASFSRSRRCRWRPPQLGSTCSPRPPTARPSCGRPRRKS